MHNDPGRDTPVRASSGEHSGVQPLREEGGQLLSSRSWDPGSEGGRGPEVLLSHLPRVRQLRIIPRHHSFVYVAVCRDGAAVG